MARADRLIDYVAAAVVAAIAVVISPFGIEVLTGRADLTFRVSAISIAIDLFLVAVIAGMVAQGRARRACFHAVIWTCPFALLGGLEAVAIGVHLADRVAPLEDTSRLAHASQWPGYLMSDARYTDLDGSLRLYRPWRGDGIIINDLGLRTAPPTPKQLGEWRIAVTGGSTVWGTRVLDADTITAQLQDILREKSRANVTIYNFGIEGATLSQEVALLRRFRDTYEIDQALFYTGANDAIFSYLAAVQGRVGPWLGAAATFEIVKAAVRLYAGWSEPSAYTLRWLDGEVARRTTATNSLRDGMIAAADLCRSARLRCDVVLQPALSVRKSASGSEATLAATLARVYPRMDAMTAAMYANALASGPAGHVHDLAHAFDDTTAPYFIDLVHLTEAGNRAVAEKLAPIVASGSSDN
jgi:lysophospholipase L1-like esterase